MSGVAIDAGSLRRGVTGKRGVLLAGVVVLLVLMVLDTTFVPTGQPLPGEKPPFSASAYGEKQFPVQQQYIVSNAVPADELAKAVKADPQAAAKTYGIASEGGVGAEIPVHFTGVVGKVPAAGYTPVEVDGLPAGIKIAVQLGPALVGTDLRDATGEIKLGDFENQIQYQDAGSAINTQMKKTVLTPAGAPDLTGKTVTVDGVFTLINPQLWNVTPAKLEVQ